MSIGYRGIGQFLLFMLVFMLGVAAIGALVFLIIRLVRRSRESAEDAEYLKFNRELDARLEKQGFKRTLFVSDDFAIDEDSGRFYCRFPFARMIEETVLPISAITEYRLEPAAAFTEGFLFTFAFMEQEPPRKVSRQEHIINEDVKQRLADALKKNGAAEAGA